MKKKLLNALGLIMMSTILMMPTSFFMGKTGLTSNHVLAADTASGTCGQTATWELNRSTGVLTISGTGELYNDGLSFSGFTPYFKEIKSVIINNGITSIGDWAFYRASLESVSIPNSVNKIGDFAFWGCENLTTLSLPEKLMTLGAYSFESCTNISAITISENNNYFSTKDGILYNKDKTELILYPSAKSQSTFTIPESVIKIGDYAFDYCNYLTEINIPSTVKSIGAGSPFCGNEKLKNINVAENNENYSSVNGDLYNKQKTSFLRYAPGKSNTELQIPESVTRIESGAFESSKTLKNITISNPECYIYNDEWTLPPNATIYGYKDSSAEDYAKDYNRTFVQLQEKEVESISIVKLPNKTEYIIGSEFDSTGLSIKVNYVDGTSFVRTRGFSLSGFNSKKAGTVTVTVNYGGETISFDIKVVNASSIKQNEQKIENQTVSPTQKVSTISSPKKASLSKLKNLKGKKVRISWKKVQNISGYQIEYATDKKFKKGKKTLNVKATATTKTIKKLKKKKTYYFRIRTYKIQSDNKTYSTWSNVKKVKIKK